MGKWVFCLIILVLGFSAFGLGPSSQSEVGRGPLQQARPSGPLAEMNPAFERKCSPQLQRWAADDDSNSLFFMFEKTPVESCKSGFDSSSLQRLTSATLTRDELARRFPPNYLGSSEVAKSSTCVNDADPKSRDLVTKYFMSTARLREGTARAVEGIAAIESIIPVKHSGVSGPLLQGISCSRFNLEQTVCSKLRSCKAQDEAARERAFTELAKSTMKAAQRLELLEKHEMACHDLELTPSRGGAALRVLNPSNGIQGRLLRNALENSNFAGSVLGGVSLFPEMRAKLNQYLTNPASVDSQSREALVNTINNACNPQVIQFLKSEILAKYPIVAQSKYQDVKSRDPSGGMNPQIMERALAEQLRENKRSLQRLRTEFDQAAQCVFGTHNGRIPCSPRQLNSVIEKTPPIPDLMSADRSFNEASTLIFQQQCIADLNKSQNEANKTLTSASVDIGLLMVTGGVSVLARAGQGAAMATRAALLSRVNLAVDSTWAARSAAQIAASCLPSQQQGTLAQTPAGSASCPLPASQALETLNENNSCAQDALFGSLDFIPFVAAAAVAGKAARQAGVADSAVSAVRSPSQPREEAPVNSVNFEQVRGTVPQIKSSRAIDGQELRQKLGSQNSERIEFATGIDGKEYVVKTVSNSEKAVTEARMYQILSEESDKVVRYVGAERTSAGVRLFTEKVDEMAVVRFDNEIGGARNLSLNQLDEIEGVVNRLLDRNVRVVDVQVIVDNAGEYKFLDPGDFTFSTNPSEIASRREFYRQQFTDRKVLLLTDELSAAGQRQLARNLERGYKSLNPSQQAEVIRRIREASPAQRNVMQNQTLQQILGNSSLAKANQLPRLSQQQLNANAQLAPEEKARALGLTDQKQIEAIRRVESGSLGRVQVSNQPLAIRPLEDQIKLSQKRDILREAGVPPEVIRRGMREGYFGAPQISDSTIDKINDLRGQRVYFETSSGEKIRGQLGEGIEDDFIRVQLLNGQIRTISMEDIRPETLSRLGSGDFKTEPPVFSKKPSAQAQPEAKASSELASNVGRSQRLPIEARSFAPTQILKNRKPLSQIEAMKEGVYGSQNSGYVRYTTEKGQPVFGKIIRSEFESSALRESDMARSVNRILPDRSPSFIGLQKNQENNWEILFEEVKLERIFHAGRISNPKLSDSELARLKNSMDELLKNGILPRDIQGGFSREGRLKIFDFGKYERFDPSDSAAAAAARESVQRELTSLGSP
jgi:hypothetical protein